jgi:hypothetical protein
MSGSSTETGVIEVIIFHFVIPFIGQDIEKEKYIINNSLLMRFDTKL